MHIAKKIIKINHLAKMEGHASFEGAILDGKMAEAKMLIEEGARLIEGTLIGRHYSEAPIITSRICGICPIVHHITAVKALEACFDVKVSREIVMLRQILELGQIIHSHGLHLFFLSLPDFLDYDDDMKMIVKYPKEAQMAIDIRKWAIDLCHVIGGRTIHPLANMIGGFRKWPDEERLKNFLEGSGDILEMTIKVAQLFRDLEYPELDNPSDFICMIDKKEYAIYNGNVGIMNNELRGKSLSKRVISVEKFMHNIEEIERPYEMVKRTHWKGKPFFNGALARVNMNYNLLNEESLKFLETTNLNFPIMNNTFYNVLAQAVEVIHCVEEIRNLLRELSFLKAKNVEFKIKAGKGVAAVEAPRGTLYHYYKVGADGYIKDCNIITPTAQFLAKLEDDLKVFLPDTLKLSNKERRGKIKMLIRAFDPCISCATH